MSAPQRDGSKPGKRTQEAYTYSSVALDALSLRTSTGIRRRASRSLLLFAQKHHSARERSGIGVAVAHGDRCAELHETRDGRGRPKPASRAMRLAVAAGRRVGDTARREDPMSATNRTDLRATYSGHSPPATAKGSSHSSPPACASTPRQTPTSIGPATSRDAGRDPGARARSTSPGSSRLAMRLSSPITRHAKMVPGSATRRCSPSRATKLPRSRSISAGTSPSGLVPFALRLRASARSGWTRRYSYTEWMAAVRGGARRCCAPAGRDCGVVWDS